MFQRVRLSPKRRIRNDWQAVFRGDRGVSLTAQIHSAPDCSSPDPLPREVWGSPVLASAGRPASSSSGMPGNVGIVGVGVSPRQPQQYHRACRSAWLNIGLSFGLCQDVELNASHHSSHLSILDSMDVSYCCTVEVKTFCHDRRPINGSRCGNRQAYPALNA